MVQRASDPAPEPIELPEAAISEAVDKALVESIDDSVPPKEPIRIVGESTEELMLRAETTFEALPFDRDELGNALDRLFSTWDTEQDAPIPPEVAELLTTEGEGVRLDDAELNAVLDSAFRNVPGAPRPSMNEVAEKMAVASVSDSGVHMLPRLPAPGSTYILMKRLGESREREVHLVCRMDAQGASNACVLVRLRTLGGLNWNARKRRFIEEATIAQSIQHPGFVPPLEVGTHGGRPFFVRKFVTGANVAQVLALSPRGRFATPIAVEIARQTAEVLGHVHDIQDPQGVSLQLAHGELSPYDIFIGPDGGIRIAEVGVTRIGLQTLRAATGGKPGHDRYAAPEQRQGWPIDGRADIFSLALIVVEGLTGKPLFGERRMRLDLLEQETRSRLGSRDDVPPRLVDLLVRMMKPVPEGRPQHAREVAEELAAILAELGGAPNLREELLPLLARVPPPEVSTPPSAPEAPPEPRRPTSKPRNLAPVVQAAPVLPDFKPPPSKARVTALAVVLLVLVVIAILSLGGQAGG